MEGGISFPLGPDSMNKRCLKYRDSRRFLVSIICYAILDDDHATARLQAAIEPKVVTLVVGFILLFYLIRG